MSNLLQKVKALSITSLLRNDREVYQSLHHDEKSDIDSGKASTRFDEHPSEKIPPTKLSILLRLSIVALTVALIVVSAFHIQLRVRISPPTRVDCGTTIEIAREKGCKFDQLSKTWLPQECPRVGLKEHLAAGFEAGVDTGDQWRYYRDQGKEVEMSIEELSELAGTDGLFFTAGREHINHCAWILTRMAYVYTHPGTRSNLAADAGHATHCIDYLLDRALQSPLVDAILSTGNVGFGSC